MKNILLHYLEPPQMKNCLGVLPFDAHLNNTTIPTQTPASSGGNETLTSPVLGPHPIFVD